MSSFSDLLDTLAAEHYREIKELRDKIDFLVARENHAGSQSVGSREILRPRRDQVSFKLPDNTHLHKPHFSDPPAQASDLVPAERSHTLEAKSPPKNGDTEGIELSPKRRGRGSIISIDSYLLKEYGKPEITTLGRGTGSEVSLGTVGSQSVVLQDVGTRDLGCTSDNSRFVEDTIREEKTSQLEAEKTNESPRSSSSPEYPSEQSDPHNQGSGESGVQFDWVSSMNPIYPELAKWFARLDVAGKGFLTPADILELFNQAEFEHEWSVDVINRAMATFNRGLVQAVQHEGSDGNKSLESVMVAKVTRLFNNDINKPLGMATISSEYPVEEFVDKDCELNLTEQGFQALITWTRVAKCLSMYVEADVVGTILQIREVLIVNTVDQLILKHSNLSLPKMTRIVPISRIERAIEPFVLVTVCVNALTIGFDADYDWTGFTVLEWIFTGIFLIELVVKFGTQGIQVLSRADWAWTYFDTIVILFACLDLLLTVTTAGDTVLGNATLLRLARLVRLTRILRLVKLLRAGCFKELFQMISGVTSGLATLFWALTLLIFLVYVAGVVMRQTIGQDKRTFGSNGDRLFPDLPQAMFTIFRCFTGDGVLIDGTPLAGRLYNRYGLSFAIPYALVMIFISFGICNLIMAIFVENVQQQARAQKAMLMAADAARFARSLRELVMLFGGGILREGSKRPVASGYGISMPFGKSPSHHPPSGILSHFQSFFWNTTIADRLTGLLPHYARQATMRLTNRRSYEGRTSRAGPLAFQYGGVITKYAFMKVMRKRKAQRHFEELEIDVRDTRDLFDILDADGSGVVDLSELISGLVKLRAGGADKSDIVATILGIRALQTKMDSLTRKVDTLSSELGGTMVTDTFSAAPSKPRDHRSTRSSCRRSMW